MYLKKLSIQNLRCFANYTIEFDAHYTLIEGCNGSGKTSLIEALYYLCYLRSFRTNLTPELISFNEPSFFIKAELASANEFEQVIEIQAGFSPEKRVVKVNDLLVSSFKQILDYYRVVVLTAEDLNIVQGAPEARRNFIDQYIYLQDSKWATLLRNYKKTLEQRNSLLKQRQPNLEHDKLWVNQLIKAGAELQAGRKEHLLNLQAEINAILLSNFTQENLQIELIYQEKNWQPSLLEKELVLERTLFGVHLEDYQIVLGHSNSRKFSSRGQQKLLIILFKIVQIRQLRRFFNGALIFLLDDFVTDLDEQKILTLFDLLGSLQVQLVFTAPNLSILHKKWLISQNAKVVTL